MAENETTFKPWHSRDEVPASKEPCVVYYEYRYGRYRGTGYARAVFGGYSWNLPKDWKVISWEYLALADFSNLRKNRRRTKRAPGVRNAPAEHGLRAGIHLSAEEQCPDSGCF